MIRAFYTVVIRRKVSVFSFSRCAGFRLLLDVIYIFFSFSPFTVGFPLSLARLTLAGELMAAKSNKCGYTGKRAKLAEMLVNPDNTETVTSMCETVGVARSTFYKWLSEPEYLEYIQGLIDQFTDSELAEVWKSLVKECKKGNVQAIKLFFELKGKYTANIKIESPFAGLTTEELRKLADDG